MKVIKDLDIKNKKVLVRCDYNVPIKDGEILDDTKIKASLETIRYCQEENAKVIIFSHLGRVKEQSDLEKNSLAPVAKRLGELLKEEVTFVDETRGEKLEQAIDSLPFGKVLLVQNTRYEDLDGKKESGNDQELGLYWASLGDYFINDAFGTIHREHASNVGIASHLESAVGFLIEKELNALNDLNNPDRPFIVILGGSKVADKIGIIENLITKADMILIGGGMAFTFLKAEGYEIGSSVCDVDSISFCQKILKEYPKKIILPVDVAVAHEFSDKEKRKEKDISDISYDEMGLDIGENTLNIFKNNLKDAKLVLWNGPIGVYEFDKYNQNTKRLLENLVENNIKTILGGGDMVASAAKAGVKDKIYHVSTGGGATLKYLEGKKLPGLEIIK